MSTTDAQVAIQWQWEAEGNWRNARSEKSAFSNSLTSRATGKRRSRTVSSSTTPLSNGSELYMRLVTGWIEKTATDPVGEKP